MAKALKRGAYHVYYSYFNFDLHLCSDPWRPFISFPEPEQKMEELSDEERLGNYKTPITHGFRWDEN